MAEFGQLLAHSILKQEEQWKKFVDSVKSGCCSSSTYRLVQPGASPWNGFELERPKKFRQGLLFILEAPPADSQHYFLKKDGPNSSPDRLRKKMYAAFQKIQNAPKFSHFDTFLDDFLDANCYLLPSFSYACANKDGTNANPTSSMAKHSGEAHLSLAIKSLQPRVVVLMGTRALAAGRAMKLVNEDLGKENLHSYARLEPYHSTAFGYGITTFVTYWPMKRSKRENHAGIKVNCYDGWLLPTLDEAFKMLRSRP